MYQLEYLPIAKQDMIDIVKYISEDLCNPSAAKHLADEMIEFADGLTTFPYKNAIHSIIKPLKHEYRRLIVKNYIMFYWVDEEQKKVVIARIIYARRDYEKLL